MVCEVFSLILCIIKIFEAFRLIQRFNFISLSLDFAIRNMIIWLCLFILFNVIMTEMAQSIWGHLIFGFQSFKMSLLTVFMIMYSKIDLQQLLNINIYYSMAFFIVYYVIVMFMWYSVFHFIQTNTVAQTARQFSMAEEYDIINIQEIKIENASKQVINQVKKK